MDWSKWISDVTKTLKSSWGLNPDFAGKVALLLAYMTAYGLSPRITSGFRSQKEQDNLYRRWLSGEPGIYKPSRNVGQHGTTGFLGGESAEAIDITTIDPGLAARIASLLGIGAGYYYQTPDPVHFYKK